MTRAPAMVALICVVVAAAEAQTPGEQQQRIARVESAARKLGALLEGNKAVSGRFVERAPGNYVFVPSRPDLPQVPVKNPNEVSNFGLGPLLDVRGEMNEKGALTVTGYDLSIPAQTALPSLPEEVKDASERLLATLNRAVQPRSMNTASRSLDQAGKIPADTQDEIKNIRKAYAAAVEAGDTAAALATAERWVDLRATVTSVFPESEEYKALYGPNDNYDAWRYDVIYRQSVAVVAIGAPDEDKARCSGVLVAEDLVLTAGHCFGGDRPALPNELEVWFYYAKNSEGNVDWSRIERRKVAELISPPPARLQEMMDGAFGATLLDYALLRFEKPADKPLTPPEAKPQCLRLKPLHKGDAVYAVGYPRGDPVMVHDSARVYLPYAIFNGPRFTQLRLDTEADLLGSPDRAKFMTEFDQSYELEQPTPLVNAKRFLHHVKDGGQPRMGIVADTFRGNSGGPVYDREHGQCVAGILLLGAPDTGLRRTVNWKDHERVVPISAVVDDVKATRLDQASRFKLEP